MCVRLNTGEESCLLTVGNRTLVTQSIAIYFTNLYWDIAIVTTVITTTTTTTVVVVVLVGVVVVPVQTARDCR